MYTQAWQRIDIFRIGSISLLTWGLLWKSVCLLEAYWRRNGIFLLLFLHHFEPLTNFKLNMEILRLIFKLKLLLPYSSILSEFSPTTEGSELAMSNKLLIDFLQFYCRTGSTKKRYAVLGLILQGHSGLNVSLKLYLYLCSHNRSGQLQSS